MIDGLPNLVIAGVAKGGTTSLFHYLAQHDEICASDVKELDYFTPLRDGNGTLAPESEYARHFAHCSGQRYRMEASPSYCYGGERVIEAMRATLGSPKVIISLRDPVQRLWSAYTFLQSMGRVSSSLTCDEYVDQCIAREGDRQTPLSVGRYAEWLPAWIGEFGEDLHVLFAEVIFDSPMTALEEILSWLDLEPDTAFDTAARNPTVEPRSQFFARAAYSVKRATDRAFASYPRLRDGLRRAYQAVNAGDGRRTMPDTTRARLEAYYAPSIRDLNGLLAGIGVAGTHPDWLGTRR